jgi:hypothetical protein
MILAATVLLPFAMLGLVVTLAWIEQRYLPLDDDTAQAAARTLGATAAPPVRVNPRTVRRRPGRHRAPAGFLAGHGPPGRRIHLRRV